jgi:hypothetical protein
VRKQLHVFGVLAAGGASLLLMTGCLSTDAGSSSLAYVNIASGNAEAIRAETVRVFADDGYQLISGPSEPQTFEREGTQRDRVLYGNYLDKQLVMRVVVSLDPRRQGGFVLRADAYDVHDGHAEKVPWVGQRPYKDLLNRVKASLVKSGGNN